MYLFRAIDKLLDEGIKEASRIRRVLEKRHGKHCSGDEINAAIEDHPDVVNDLEDDKPEVPVTPATPPSRRRAPRR